MDGLSKLHESKAWNAELRSMLADGYRLEFSCGGRYFLLVHSRNGNRAQLVVRGGLLHVYINHKLVKCL